MKTRSTRLAALAIAFVGFGSAAILTIDAQQNTTKPRPLAVTTNWVGFLVVGKIETRDRISPTPAPTTVPQVAIGLRSDGVVVWQEAGKTR
jgi:hypothetical protein